VLLLPVDQSGFLALACSAFVMFILYQAHAVSEAVVDLPDKLHQWVGE